MPADLRQPGSAPGARRDSGDMASMTYADPDRLDDESERQKIRESLLEYCKLDTLAMVMIWQKLSDIAEIS